MHYITSTLKHTKVKVQEDATQFSGINKLWLRKAESKWQLQCCIVLHVPLLNSDNNGFFLCVL